MKHKYILILFIALAFCFLHANVQATSFYSGHGLGMVAEEVSAQNIGLGGTCIAVPETRGLSSLNPATLLPAKVTRLTVHFVHETNFQENSTGSGTDLYNNAFGAQFLVPIGNRFSVSTGLVPIFYADYTFTNETTGESAYKNILSGKGSLNKAFLNFYAKITNRIEIGAGWNYVFGKYDQTWNVDYYSGYYADTKDILKSKLNGYFLNAGFVARVYKNLHIGGVYSMPYSLTSENSTKHNFTHKITEYSSDYVVTTFSDSEVDLPTSWGIGSSIEFLDKKFLIAGDFYTKQFSGITTNINQSYNDYYRLSFGIRYLPSRDPFTKYYRQIPLRTGVFWKQLQHKYANSDPIHEMGITFGAGLPFYFSLGRIDMSLVLGKRGNLSGNPVEEKFVNLMVSVTGGETWFIKGRGRRQQQ